MLKHNDSSAISVLTIDNAFASQSVGKVNESVFFQKIDKQKKRKKNDKENKDIWLLYICSLVLSAISPSVEFICVRI